MNGSIYDFGALPRLALPLAEAGYVPPLPLARTSVGTGLVGLVSNPRSHRNIGSSPATLARPDVIATAPPTRAELCDTMAMFQRKKIDLLVIDGGDGTIRDVLTCAGDLWHDSWPAIAVLPSGKTNALGVDLGVPSDWSLDAAIEAAVMGGTVVRSPIEVASHDGSGVRVRGFIFGAGAFVDATALAQRTHKAGAFNGLAVGLSLAWGIGQTLFGGAGSAWRRGSQVGLAYDRGAVRMHGTTPDGVDQRYIMLASTLHRLPAGLKPFGQPRPGMKTLVVDAPPRQLALALAPLLAGSEAPMLEERGYHRVDATEVAIDMDTGFILDGETFPAGAYTLRQGAPLRFVVP